MKKDSYKKPTPDELKKKLTPLQFEVTQNESTETPYHNEYWDNKADGIYVDIVSGEALFSSLDKFDSGCGWPSFTKPIDKVELTTKADNKISEPRTEIRSPIADSHIGHVFDRWPVVNKFQNVTYVNSYCANSAALRFVPVAEMEAQGYGEYLYLFN